MASGGEHEVLIVARLGCGGGDCVDGSNGPCGVVALLEGALTERVLARLPAVSSRLCEWFGVLLALWRVQERGAMDAALELRVGSEELVRLLHALRSPTPSQQQRLLLSQVRVWERPALEEAARLLCGWPGPLRVLWVPQEESDGEAAMAMAAARQAARDGPPLQGRPLDLLEAALAWRVAYEQAVRELGEDAALEVRLNERFHPPPPRPQN